MPPETKPRFSPRDFFLNLSALAALYVSVISFLALLFEIIDTLHPDELSYSDPYSTGIRLAIASLIVVFPVFLDLTRIVNQDLRRSPEKREYGLRKWLLFITLFIAGATLVGDMIALLNTFLGGEITTRFILKVAAVLIVVGSVFDYYFLDLRGWWQTRESLSKLAGLVAGIAVLATVIGGFFIMGSPSEQRALRMDQERVYALQSIQWQIVEFWRQKETLPSALSELEDPLVGFIVPTDPQTGDAYEYERTSNSSFKVCATFERKSLDEKSAINRDFTYMVADTENWTHDAGRTCFDRTIDPERFPPYTKI